MADLELVNVKKFFGKTAAIKDVSLKIEDGSLVCLLGPSGCGKTTMLRIIAGLEMANGGSIIVDGENIKHVPSEKRNIGMVFQRYALFPHMTVYQNIAFGLESKKQSNDIIKVKIEKILELMQLQGLESRFPQQLSGGQMQRVALARTLVTEPKMLLLDEPLANLDRKLRDEMKLFIKSLQRKLHVTMIFVTHDQSEAIELADKIAIMSRGSIIQYGSTEWVYSHPQTVQAANFLGGSNVFRCNDNGVHIQKKISDTQENQEKKEHAKTQMHNSDTQYAHIDINTEIGILSVGANAYLTRALDTQEIYVMCRSEHTDIKRQKTEYLEISNVFRTKIIEKIFLGEMINYRVQLANVDINIKKISNAENNYSEGDEVYIRFSPSNIRLLQNN